MAHSRSCCDLVVLLLIVHFDISVVGIRSPSIRVIEERPMPYKRHSEPTYSPVDKHAPQYFNYGVPPCGEGTVLRVTYRTDAKSTKIYATFDARQAVAVEAGDTFEYEMMWETPGARAATEIEISGKWRLRDDGPADQNGHTAHCEKSSIAHLATRKWYRRVFPLDNIQGRSVDTYVMSADPGESKVVYALFKSIRIMRGNEVRRIIWDGTRPPPRLMSYYPGSVTAECSKTLRVDGRLEGNRTVEFGKPTRYTVTLSASDLTQQWLADDECESVGTCNTKGIIPLIHITAAHFYVHHEGMPGGQPLLTLYKWEASRPDQPTPTANESAVVAADFASYDLSIRIPSATSRNYSFSAVGYFEDCFCSSLLNSSRLHVKVWYRLHGNDTTVREATVVNEELAVIRTQERGAQNESSASEPKLFLAEEL